MSYRERLPEYVRILNAYGPYEGDGDAAPFVYEHGGGLQDLREAYRLDAVAGDGDEIARLANVARWVSDSIPYDGNSVPPEEKSALAILAAARAHGTGANCWLLAVVVCEAYLALGYPARYVRCLPYDYRDPDCHVVSLVRAATLDKWVMFDPSFNAWVHDGTGAILSLEEMRERLATGKRLAVSDGLRGMEPEEYLAYMAKNLVHLESPVTNGMGSDDRESARYVRLAPCGFDARAWSQRGLDGRGAWVARMRGEHPEDEERYRAIEGFIAAARDTALHRTIYTRDARSFWGPPGTGQSAT